MQTGCVKYILTHLPAVKPVFTDVAFDHKPAHIVGLPADTVQRGRRHLPTVPKQRRNEAGGDSIRRPEIPEGEPRAHEIRHSTTVNPTSDVIFQIGHFLLVVHARLLCQLSFSNKGIT